MGMAVRMRSNPLCEIPCSDMMTKDRKKENIVRQTSTDEDIGPNKIFDSL